MAAPVSTAVTATAVGIREDLENVIYKIASVDVPFTKAIGSGKITNTTPEWQLINIRAAAENAQLEGDDVGTFNATRTPVRVKNYAQIFTEDFVISKTHMAVDLAGRANEVAFQKVIKGQEVANDIEKAFLSNTASRAENTAGGLGRKLGGALAWITTNDSRGVGGSQGGFNTGTGIVDAATNGTQRALTEALFKGLMATAYDNGAKLKMALMSITHKQVVSNFTGNATNMNTKAGEINAYADVYSCDAGKVMLVPTQSDHGLSRDILFIDPSMWSIGRLRPMQTTKLAETGDNEKHQMVTELTLKCLNEKGSAVLADLTTDGL